MKILVYNCQMNKLESWDRRLACALHLLRKYKVEAAEGASLITTLNMWLNITPDHPRTLWPASPDGDRDVRRQGVHLPLRLQGAAVQDRAQHGRDRLERPDRPRHQRPGSERRAQDDRDHTAAAHVRQALPGRYRLAY